MSFDSLLAKAQLEGNCRLLEDYYEGTTHLDALGVSLPPNVRLLEMVAPFPKFAVDVLTEALNPEGFLLAGDKDIPALLRRWWQANNLDTAIKLAITEALVQGQAFLIIGYGTDDTPRMTVHTKRGMAVHRDHMGAVDEALRVYTVDDIAYAAHYLPGETLYYRQDSGLWKPVDVQTHPGLDRPLVVPITNRLRIDDVDGRSEILDVVTISDAASRTLTNMQVAQELLAMPVRYIFSDGIESPATLEESLKSYFGHFIAGPDGGSAGQIPGASLQSFIDAYKLYAQIISSITGIPPSMLGIATDNPASAEAMRVAKDRLIGRAEVKQDMFGDAIEDAARLALALYGHDVSGLETLELSWRDPALTSASAKTASMLQAQAQGVVSAETARDYLQLTPEQKARENAAAAELAAFRAQLGA